MPSTAWKLTAGRLALCGEYVMSLTGKRTDRSAKSLRAIGEVFVSDGEQLGLTATWRTLPLDEADRIASSVTSSFRQLAAWGLEEIGLIDAARGFSAPAGEPLNAAAEAELIYVARAGITLVKRLAVVGLAQSENRQGIATLRQAVYDSDEETALGALESLRQIDPANLAVMLQNTVRAMTEPGEPPRKRIIDALLLCIYEVDPGGFPEFAEELLANEQSSMTPTTRARCKKLASLATAE
jgi:hypothetical protein